jgi:hypothetical protein
MATIGYILIGIFLVFLFRKLLMKNRGKTPWSSTDTKYDVFISYNTQSSVQVRKIVDYLLANNIKVWFAEYLIPINAQYNEAEFREKYLDAITRSGICLIAKNHHYANSKYCREEYEKINRIHNDENIITLLMEDEDIQQTGKNEIKYSFNLKEVFDLLSKKLEKKLTFPENHLQFFQGDFIDLIHINHLFQFDRTGWVETTKDTSSLKVDKYDSVGPQLVRIFEGLKVELQFSVGRDSQSSVRYNKNQDFKDDRAFRREMIEWVQEHFRKRAHLKLAGIHLFFLNEKSHSVFTYFNRNCWTRRYSLIDFYPKWPDKNFEIIMHYSIYGNFQKYCAIAPYLDRMVETMNYYEIHKQNYN